MIDKTRAILALAALAASVAASPADARVARQPHRATASGPAFVSAPARMIEVRPGLWVGSYQCVTDLDRGGRDCSSSP
jgi:hypothetical protein